MALTGIYASLLQRGHDFRRDPLFSLPVAGFNYRTRKTIFLLQTLDNAAQVPGLSGQILDGNRRVPHCR